MLSGILIKNTHAYTLTTYTQKYLAQTQSHIHLHLCIHTKQGYEGVDLPNTTINTPIPIPIHT